MHSCTRASAATRQGKPQGLGFWRAGNDPAHFASSSDALPSAQAVSEITPVKQGLFLLLRDEIIQALCSVFSLTSQ